MNEQFERYKDEITSKLPEIPLYITEEWLQEALQNDLFSIWGFTFSDLSNHSFGNISEETLRRVSISTYTKLPESHPFNLDFNSQIDYDIKELNNIGINGNGINVAVIDKGFLPNHDEVKTCLKYYKNFDNKYSIDGFHGLTVTSNLAGKNLGIAPESNVYFYGCTTTAEEQDKYYLEALKDIYSKNLNGENIRIVNISAGRHMNGPLKEDFQNMYNLLQAQGCYVIDAFTWNPSYFDSFQMINQRNTNGIPHYYLSEWQGNFNTISDAYKEKIQQQYVAVPFSGIVPLIGTTNGYQLGGDMSLSWILPRICGIFALCLQVNPNLTYDDFCQLAKSTKTITEEGIPIINPKGMIEKLSLDLEETRAR